MDENQIEVFASSGNTPEQLATTTSIGLAKFNPNDFMVTVDGEVQSLTKTGIAFTLRYKGVDDVARYYSVDTNIGRQNPKIGDVGLVVIDEIQPIVGQNGNQNGTIVRLTSMKSVGQNPFIWYGEVIGSILGPEGKVGPQALQCEYIYPEKPNDFVKIENAYFNREVRMNDVYTLYYLDVEDGKSVLWQAQAKVNNPNDNGSSWAEVIYRGRVTGYKGDLGTKIVTGELASVTSSLYTWLVNQNYGEIRIGDIIIAPEAIHSEELDVNINRGSMYVIAMITSDNRYITKSIPSVQTQDFQLGIWNLSNPVVNDNDTITFKYSTVDNSQIPYIGNLGLCIDDNYPDNFGKFYIITGVNQETQTVVTSNVGASIVGPVQDITIGQVTTIPNKADGSIGDATANMTVVDSLNKKLNLGIPAGQKGEQGIQGVQGIPGPAGVANVNARGTYDVSVAYVQNDLVYFDTQYTNESFGGSYIRTENLPGQTGLTPKDNSTAWALFVAEGAPGPQGPVGPDGNGGADGAFQLVVGLNEYAYAKQIYYKAPNVKVGDTVTFYVVSSTATYANVKPAAGDIVSGKIEQLSNTEIRFADMQILTSTVGPSGALQAIFNSQVGNATPNVELSILYKGKFNVGDRIAFLCKGSFKSPYYTYQPYSIAIGTVSNIGTLSVTFSTIDSLVTVLPSYDIITIQPVSGNLPVQGTFTEQQLNTLQGNDNAIIMRDNERYVLMDKQHDTGYLIYTHVGHNSANNFNVKCITVTVNTRAWVFTEQKITNNYIVLDASFEDGSEIALNDAQVQALKNDKNCGIYLSQDEVLYIAHGFDNSTYIAYDSVKLGAATNAVYSSVLLFYLSENSIHMKLNAISTKRIMRHTIQILTPSSSGYLVVWSTRVPRYAAAGDISGDKDNIISSNYVTNVTGSYQAAYPCTIIAPAPSAAPTEKLKLYYINSSGTITTVAATTFSDSVS